MQRAPKLRLKKLSENGVAAVEFAVVLSVFLMMLLGIVEFGYDWYLKHAITNASRDGARYGVMYRMDNSSPPVRLAPVRLPYGSWKSIEGVVGDYLRQTLPAGATWTVACSGDGYTRAQAGDQLTITVSSRKTWSALGSMIPQLKDMNVTATTVMLSE